MVTAFAPEPTSRDAPSPAPLIGDPTAAPTAAPTEADATDPTPVQDEDPPSPDDERDGGGEQERPTFKHRGFVTDFGVGLIGCTNKLCNRHDNKPGLRLDGFIGGNLLGFVDIGIMAAWGTMGSDIEPGTDGLSLYGISLAEFPQPVQDMVNADALVVSSARLDTVQAGFNVRAHFIPRGRVDAYVGAAAGYQLFRALYDTDAGATRIAFHGLAFPLQAGLVVFVHPNVAVGAQFDYILTWYGAVSVRGAAGEFGAPLSRVKEQAEQAGVDLPGDLPHLWAVGGVVHLRFGR